MKYIVSEIKCIRCKKQFSENYFLSYVHGNGRKKLHNVTIVDLAG